MKKNESDERVTQFGLLPEGFAFARWTKSEVDRYLTDRATVYIASFALVEWAKTTAWQMADLSIILKNHMLILSAGPQLALMDSVDCEADIIGFASLLPHPYLVRVAALPLAAAHVPSMSGNGFVSLTEVGNSFHMPSSNLVLEKSEITTTASEVNWTLFTRIKQIVRSSFYIDQACLSGGQASFNSVTEMIKTTFMEMTKMVPTWIVFGTVGPQEVLLQGEGVMCVPSLKSFGQHRGVMIYSSPLVDPCTALVGVKDEVKSGLCFCPKVFPMRLPDSSVSDYCLPLVELPANRNYALAIFK